MSPIAARSGRRGGEVVTEPGEPARAREADDSEQRHHGDNRAGPSIQQAPYEPEAWQVKSCMKLSDGKMRAGGWWLPMHGDPPTR